MIKLRNIVGSRTRLRRVPHLENTRKKGGEGMVSEETIASVANQLRAATNFTMVFGILPGSDIVAKKKALRDRFIYLSQLVHPDHAPDMLKIQANETFQMLNELRFSAEAAIEAGIYDQPLPSAKTSVSASVKDSSIELQSSKGIYHLVNKPLCFGDFSAIYTGRFQDVGVQTDVVVKIALEPQNNPWLENEARILERFKSASKTDALFKLKPYVPELLDSFLVSGGGGKRFRAVSLRRIPNMVSIEEIIKAYPNGLDPEDAAWVCRRAIAQTLVASMAKVVHGALTPDHILVDPIKREPLHIGWAHAIDDPHQTGRRITYIVDRWKNFYPPEVFDKKLPDHRSDIFMVGKTMIYILGGDTSKNIFPSSVPVQIANVVLRCVERNPARRPQNGKEIMDEFTHIVRNLWKRSYRPLTLPAHQK